MIADVCDKSGMINQTGKVENKSSADVNLC
jgi:hypothetical protein